MFYQNCGSEFNSLKKSDTTTENSNSSSEPQPTHLFKEDFETKALDTSTWRWVQETATYTLDTTRSYRGQTSLKINTSNINKNPWNLGFIETNRAFPLTGKSLFIRAFVYLDTPIPNRHFTVLTAKSAERPPTAGTWDYKVNLIPNGTAMQWRYLWNYGNVGAGQLIDSNPAEGPQSGRWACWEWQINGVNRQLQFWYDDVLIPNFSATVGTQWALPAKVKAQFGFSTSHRESYGDEGYNIWLDDIAIDDKKIGCAN